MGIRKEIEELANNLPAPDTTKMRGKILFHKVRSGDYQLMDEIHDLRLIILVVKVEHQKDVYKRLPCLVLPGSLRYKENGRYPLIIRLCTFLLFAFQLF